MDKRVLLSAVACSAAIAVIGIVAHTLLAHDFFYGADVTGGYYRPEGPWRSVVIPGTFVEALGFAWVYHLFGDARTGVRHGIRFGLGMGVFMIGLAVIIQYGICEIPSATWMLGEGVYIAAQAPILGAIVGALQKS